MTMPFQLSSKTGNAREVSHRSVQRLMLTRTGRRLAYLVPMMLLAIHVILGTNRCLAQSSFLSMAPARYIVATQIVSGGDATDFALGFERAIPVANLLPQVSPDSHVEFLRVIVGMRLADHGHKELRGRITAVDLEIQKQPWAASFSFLDVNASGIVELEANWLSLGVGTGLDLGNSSIRLLVRGQAMGAMTSSKFGSLLFPDAGPGADNLRHTASYGAKGVVGVLMPNRARLLLDYATDRYAIDAGVGYTSWRLAGVVFLSRKVQLLASYSEVSLTIDQFEDDARMFGFGVHYTPTDTY